MGGIVWERGVEVVRQLLDLWKEGEEERREEGGETRHSLK